MAGQDDRFPGAAGLHLAEGVALLRPEEQVFEAMLDGAWLLAFDPAVLPGRAAVILPLRDRPRLGDRRRKGEFRPALAGTGTPALWPSERGDYER